MCDTDYPALPVTTPPSGTLVASSRRRQFILTCLAACALPGLAHAASGVNSEAAQAHPVVLVVGDSISAEYGLPRGTGWVKLLADRVAAQHLPYTVQNSSISGDTTSGGLSRLPGLLAQVHPKIVVIELGANDALRGLSLDMTRANLQKMAALCTQAGARVVIVGMQVPTNYGPVYTKQFAQVFAEVAQSEHAALVPFLLAGIATDMSHFQSDGLHPNAASQPQLVNNVWPVLEPVLKASR